MKERYRVSALAQELNIIISNQSKEFDQIRLLKIGLENNASMRCFILSRLTYAVVKVLLKISAKFLQGAQRHINQLKKNF